MRPEDEDPDDLCQRRSNEVIELLSGAAEVLKKQGFHGAVAHINTAKKRIQNLTGSYLAASKEVDRLQALQDDDSEAT